jgi:hypothetical protein
LQTEAQTAHAREVSAAKPTIPSLAVTAEAGGPQGEAAKRAIDLARPEKTSAEKSLQRESVMLDGKPTIVQVDPDPNAAIKVYDLEGKPIEKAAVRVRPMPPASVVYPKPPGAEKLIKVEHKGSDGKTVIEWLPESQVRGQTFEKGTSATIQNRLDSAQAVNQTGNDIIAQLKDPKVASKVGPLMGRASSLRDFIGNPPPEFQELAGSIESYALANMGVHGMRSVQGAEQIKKMLDAKHTPESLIAAIQGLNKFSTHFLENEGMGKSAAPATPKKNPFKP